MIDLTIVFLRNSQDRRYQRPNPGGGVGGGGYSDIFIRTLARVIFLFKILNFNIFGGFQKNKYFGGMKILWLFYLGHLFMGYWFRMGVVFFFFFFFFFFFGGGGGGGGLLKFQIFFWGA